MIYITCFILSVGLFYIAKDQKGIAKKGIVFLAIMIPCVLAGIRGNTVGTDVHVYLEPMVSNARYAKSFSDYMRSSWQQGWVIRGVYDIEVGFSVLVYVIIKLFNSIYVLQFAIQWLTIYPIYVGLKEKNTDKVWLGMLVYFCMFYNGFLNIMRQGIAIGFLFLAFQYLFNEKKKRFFTFLIVACLFHNSGAIGLIIWFIYEYIGMNIFKNSKRFGTAGRRLFILICFGLAFLLAQGLITTIMRQVGLDYYVHYISGNITFLPNQLIVRLPVLIVCYYMRKRLYQEEGDMFFFHICCVIYTVIFAQYTSVNAFAYRIAMNFSALLIGFIPDIASVPSRITFNKKSLPKLNQYIMVVYMLVWWVYYCLILTDSTLPYVTPFI